MPFFDREEDIRRMKAVLSGEPNLVYFVYGLRCPQILHT